MQSDFLRAALQAAEAAAELIKPLYQSNLEVRTKADKSPVTVADVQAEKLIRALLEERFPAHGFYGEETGERDRDAEYLWLVDPIDGTKAFVREYAMFSTQIALMHRGELIVGVSIAPVYGELAYAEKGGGAWLNGRQIHVSEIERIEDASVSTGNLKSLARGGQWAAYGGIVARADRIRGYGDFLHYHLLASGRIDAALESDVNILDIAALAVIVEEAGGRFTDLVTGACTLRCSPRSLTDRRGRTQDNGVSSIVAEARAARSLTASHSLTNTRRPRNSSSCTGVRYRRERFTVSRTSATGPKVQLPSPYRSSAWSAKRAASVASCRLAITARPASARERKLSSTSIW
jgi:histidinol-phosphatase